MKESDLESFPQRLETTAKEAGLNVNAEKVTSNASYVKFLQRIHIKGYNTDQTVSVKGKDYPIIRGIYSLNRATNSKIYPERFHRVWNGMLFVLRDLSIDQNCVDHPGFIPFMIFTFGGSRHFREFFETMSNTEISKLQGQSRDIPGFYPTYNQSRKKDDATE